MSSQVWGSVSILCYLLGLYLFFFPQKNSCFSSQRCLDIIASELQFYYMKYLMFCLKQHSLKEPIC